jgi:hypothetical protein
MIDLLFIWEIGVTDCPLAAMILVTAAGTAPAQAFPAKSLYRSAKRRLAASALLGRIWDSEFQAW